MFLESWCRKSSKVLNEYPHQVRRINDDIFLLVRLRENVVTFLQNAVGTGGPVVTRWP